MHLGAFAAVRVLIVGDVVLDHYIEGAVHRISPEAPVPVLNWLNEFYIAGGAGNVAANVAALGAEASLISVVGMDKEADILRSRINVGSSGCVRFIATDHRPTSTKTRLVSDKHQLLRLDREVASFIEPDVATELLAAFDEEVITASVIVLSDYGKGVLSDQVLKHVLARAKERNIPTLVDPKRKDFKAYRGATLIAPNRKELSDATGLPCRLDSEAVVAAGIAIQQTDAAILLTRSEDGMSLFSHGNESVHLSTEAHSVVDVTGAGDTVIAVMAIATGAHMAYPPAIRLANIAAGIVVTKAGTAVVTKDELSAHLVTMDAEEHVHNTEAVSLKEAVRIRENWAAQGLSVGFTNGCFDLLHPGHLAVLRSARAECDRLIVAVNSDASVKRLKGPSRPIQDEHSRSVMLRALDPVDLVLIFEQDTPLDAITALKPDVLVKGGDYDLGTVVGADVVIGAGGKVVLSDLIKGQSTTSMVQRSLDSITAR